MTTRRNDALVLGTGLDDTAPVESLRYLAGKSKAALNAIGVHSVGDLKRIGVIDAYLTMKVAGVPVSLNFLWAMYAGLMSVEIHRLDPEFKAAVKAQLDR